MDYLYFLQNLRDSAPVWCNEMILFVSEMIGGSVGLVLLALIYWCISKQAGIFLLMNFSFSQICNTIVKNICCVERPFLRDTRLTPYTPVTGYSFPSGHTMMAASFYGGVAVWQRKRRWLAAICVFMAFFTAFTRNWLGAHTLEDVLVGIVLSCGVIALNAYLLSLVEKRPAWDVWVLAGALAVCVLMCLLFPAGLKYIGMYAGVMLGWFLERHFVRFEIRGGFLYRFLTFLPGIAVTAVLYKLLLPAMFASLDSGLAGALNYGITFLFVVAGWPAVLQLAGRRFDKNCNT